MGNWLGSENKNKNQVEKKPAPQRLNKISQHPYLKPEGLSPYALLMRNRPHKFIDQIILSRNRGSDINTQLKLASSALSPIDKNLCRRINPANVPNTQSLPTKTALNQVKIPEAPMNSSSLHLIAPATSSRNHRQELYTLQNQATAIQSQAKSPTFSINTDSLKSANSTTQSKNQYSVANSFQNQPSTVAIPSPKVSNQSSNLYTSHYSEQVKVEANYSTLTEKYETKSTTNKWPEKSSPMFTVNYPPSDYDSSSNSYISSCRSSVCSDTIQYRPISDLNAAAKKQNIHNYSSERSSPSPNQRRGRGRGRWRGSSIKRESRCHSPKSYKPGKDFSDSSSDSSQSNTYSEFISFIL
ncbi:unnamed protein product [Blepharisma stoltei]|uniref:Uncharacterized protein n=1 Tax=Blepharisma stoltei TaxID=1481888 RepID=A0AAU9JVA9_9CILI|nr:unnamed protein product [Blepharisma stoltei]